MKFSCFLLDFICRKLLDVTIFIVFSSTSRACEVWVSAMSIWVYISNKYLWSWSSRLNAMMVIDSWRAEFFYRKTWWRHQMETFSALLTLGEGNPSITGEFPSQRPVTRSFDVFFDLRLNKRLSKRSRRRWSGTPSRPLCHCNECLKLGNKLTIFNNGCLLMIWQHTDPGHQQISHGLSRNILGHWFSSWIWTGRIILWFSARQKKKTVTNDKIWFSDIQKKSGELFWANWPSRVSVFMT